MSEPFPLLPDLLRHGFTHMMAVVQAWWNLWRRRRRPTLTSTLKAATGTVPVGELGRMLEAVGWDGTPLSPQAVAALTTRLVARRDAEASSRLRPWERGPDASRPALPKQYALGRAMFGRLPPIQQVRGPDGTVATDPADIDAVLWDSRKDIWTSAPTHACASQLPA